MRYTESPDTCTTLVFPVVAQGLGGLIYTTVVVRDCRF